MPKALGKRRLGLPCVWGGGCWALDASLFPPGLAPPISDCVHRAARPQVGELPLGGSWASLGSWGLAMAASLRSPFHPCFCQALISIGVPRNIAGLLGFSYDSFRTSACLSTHLGTHIQTFLVTPAGATSGRHTDLLYGSRQTPST